jgi:hypothetical protein
MAELQSHSGQTTATSQRDIDMWRILKKALRLGLSDRGFIVAEDEILLMTRFMMEHIENRGLRVVPLTPTSEMQSATRRALDEGKRMSLSWVKWRTKQRWRYQAAIDAAPSWRRGYDQEVKDATDQATS